MQPRVLPRRRGRRVVSAWAWVSALWLAACAPIPPQPGQARAAVLAAWGQPTATYALGAGVQRLEYASGPYGRTTWMIDVDDAGLVTQARQVLSEAEFLRVQTTTGLPRQALLLWLGRPGERRGGGWAGGEVWSWRYPTMDCRWFQVSLSDEGVVTSAAYGVDPVCEVVSDAP